MQIIAFYQRHRKKIIGGVVALSAIAVLWFFFHRPSQPTYVTAVAARGDLIQTVEAVGTVTSDRDLKLQFSLGGVVASVNVKEGDRVRAGQLLVALRAGNRAAASASASASVAAAQAQLASLVEGTRPEEIAIAEADVQNKRAALESVKTALATTQTAEGSAREKLIALQTEAATALAGDTAGARTTIGQQLVVAENAVSVIRDVLSDNSVQDAAIKGNPAEYNGIQSQLPVAQSAVDAARADHFSDGDFEEALRALSLTQTALTAATGSLDRTFALLGSIAETPSFTSAARETMKNKIAAQRSLVQAGQTTVNTTLRNLRDSSAGYDTRIVAERSNLAAATGAERRAQSDILTYQSALRSQEAQLALKRAGARPTDIDAASARVRQAQADLARAAADYRDTLLAAPVDGIVTKVNVKVGEYTPAGPVVTMLGSSPYRIEMFVSEIDIPKVHLAQSGSIELDAFRGTHFKLTVSAIDPAVTFKEGVSKYRVVLDFVYSHDELKVGMTGDAAIVTGKRTGVVAIPLRAIIAREDGSKIVRVLGRTGKIEERTIRTGMEGAGGDAEVSGVGSGEVVVVLVKQ